MKLSDYFTKAQGLGVLATADSAGKVDLAVYASPHFIDEETVAFIMGDHLSYRNLQSNPHAAYLFHQAGAGYNGKRLYLTRSREESDPARIQAVRRKTTPPECPADGEGKHLVYFHVDQVRPLVGDAT